MKEGAAAAKAEKPDLAILDVMLPDGDGFSLMEQLRVWTDIPVIFLTARDEATDRLAGLGLGADDYIAVRWISAGPKQTRAARYFL